MLNVSTVNVWNVKNFDTRFLEKSYRKQNEMLDIEYQYSRSRNSEM